VGAAAVIEQDYKVPYFLELEHSAMLTPVDSCQDSNDRADFVVSGSAKRSFSTANWAGQILRRTQASDQGLIRDRPRYAPRLNPRHLTQELPFCRAENRLLFKETYG
jgi:hypothetical protein